MPKSKNVIKLQGLSSILLVSLGVVLTSISLPWCADTIQWAFSSNWNSAGNAMPLLMVFIIPIAIVCWSGLLFGLTALGVGIFKSLKTPIAASSTATERNKVLNQRVVVFLIISAALLYNLGSVADLPLAVLIVVLELAALSVAGTFAYKTGDRRLLISWGAAILLLLVLTCMWAYRIIMFYKELHPQ